MSVKAVPVMRVAMAAAFIASAMVQAAELAAAATELVRRRTVERRKKEILPLIPQQLSLPLSFHCLLHPLSW
jgi:hypothetical protein